MEIIKKKQIKLKEIIKSIKKGRVIVCPTDTVYGLIADATNKKAVEKIFKIKNRPKNKAIPVFVKNLKQAKKLTKIDKKQEKFFKKVWPGKLTAVLKRKYPKLKLYGAGKETIGIRIPKYKLIINLIKKINRPLSETSVNISGKPPIIDIKAIIKHFKNKKIKPDLIIDAGNLKKSKPSKVIDLTGKKVKILRK